MTYYSGASKIDYETNVALDEKFPAREKKICCFDSDRLGEYTARNLAQAFAHKRARQDDSEPVVIEITKPEDFEISFEGYPILKGRLNPQNHNVHSDIEKLLDVPI